MSDIFNSRHIELLKPYVDHIYLDGQIKLTLPFSVQFCLDDLSKTLHNLLVTESLYDKGHYEVTGVIRDKNMINYLTNNRTTATTKLKFYTQDEKGDFHNINKDHNSEGKLICTVCGTKFKDESALKIHVAWFCDDMSKTNG